MIGAVFHKISPAAIHYAQKRTESEKQKVKEKRPNRETTATTETRHEPAQTRVAAAGMTQSLNCGRILKVGQIEFHNASFAELGNRGHKYLKRLKFPFKSVICPSATEEAQEL